MLSLGLMLYLSDSKVRALKDYCFSCRLSQPTPSPEHWSSVEQTRRQHTCGKGIWGHPKLYWEGGVILREQFENMCVMCQGPPHC